MNIFYIGSSGALSLTPFKKLLSSEHSVAAVGVFNPIFFDKKIIALENSSLSLLSTQNNIPVIDLSQASSLIVDQCENLSIDIILVSCYARRLPEDLINLARLGCFNMHPSLLPQFRGPEPIFWQMKKNSDKGVSWHHVVEGFDAGDVVKQKVILLEDGISYQEVNNVMANAGTELMMQMLAEVAVDKLAGSPQQAELSSYFRYPKKHDFVVDIAGSAQQAFNFMRATEAFGHSYLCQIGNYRYVLDKALDYDNNDHLQDAEVSGNTLYIPCNEGVLIATFTGKL